ncbi:hypothetical protein V1509DRAFT_643626 [Lipomyces kononenkoae]
MPLASVHRAQVKLYGSADDQPNHMDEEARMFRPTPGQNEADGRPYDGIGLHPQALNDSTEHGPSDMVDDDELVVLESGVKVFARELGDEQVVFCPVCETGLDKTAGRWGK